MKTAIQGAFWIVVYLLVAIAPLVLALAGPEPGRGFLVDFSVALGFVGLSMMGLQFVLVARLRAVSAPFGIDVLLQYHRQISYVALLFVLAHPVLLFAADAEYLALMNLAEAPWRARMAVLSSAALLLLVALSVWRKKLRLSYELWQITHGVLAVLVVAAAIVHVFFVGYYVNEVWERILWLLASAAFVSLVLWIYVVRPFQYHRKAWRIEEVIPERGNTATVVLKPRGRHARDFEGFDFEPGQFAWIMVGKSPFAVTQHPFSISSSAERKDRVALSIKSAGDFTREVGSLEPGATVYLDGPHGAFTVDRHEGPGFVLVGAGVGITPLMSAMRTLADREDVRPVYLFLGNRDWETITFREEIEGLKTRLDLKVTYVLSDPPEDWEGEVGRINAGMFERHLPERNRERLQYLICGPDAMMDAAESCLVGVLGVPADRVHTERFGMV